MGVRVFAEYRRGAASSFAAVSHLPHREGGGHRWYVSNNSAVAVCLAWSAGGLWNPDQVVDELW